MSLFLKLFNTTAEYNAYTADTSNFILPNVSLIEENMGVCYNPIQLETKVVAKFNVTDTSNPTQIISQHAGSPFSEIEIDGVEQPSVTSTYTFGTLGEHTVKYTLTDPTSIYDNAFWDCSGLTSINIPDSVATIGNSAFSNCSALTSCTIGSGVISIGDWALYGCSGLTNIDIPSGVTSIGMGAFQQCSGLTSINIPSGVTSIGNQAFYICTSLTSIVSNAMTAPTIQNSTFRGVKTGGTLTVPSGSSGYDTWMQNANYYLGLYNWTKVEQ